MSKPWKLYRILDEGNEARPIPGSGFETLTYCPDTHAVRGDDGALEVSTPARTHIEGRRVAVVRSVEHPGLRLCFEARPPSTHEDVVRGLLGTWACHHVDQERSDDGDDGDGRREVASQTVFAETTITFTDDGRFSLLGGARSRSAHGTWEIERDGRLALVEADDSFNGFEGLRWASFDGRDQVRVGWRLADDSHDGLDVLVLEFARP